MANDENITINDSNIKQDQVQPEGDEDTGKVDSAIDENAREQLTDDKTQEEQPEVEEAEGEKLKKELAEQTARAEDYFNRLARMQADFENYRRRTQKEREEFLKYASEQLILALLPVMDNFQRALEARDEDPHKVIEGVEMIFRQIEDILTREGLESIPAVGEEFDPSRHEAVMQEETTEYPENTVTQELRRGYYLKGKVIRPAMVKVAKA